MALKWGISPVDGHWVPYDDKTGEPLWCGDRLELEAYEKEHSMSEAEQIHEIALALGVSVADVQAALEKIAAAPAPPPMVAAMAARQMQRRERFEAEIRKRLNRKTTRKACDEWRRRGKVRRGG